MQGCWRPIAIGVLFGYPTSEHVPAPERSFYEYYEPASSRPVSGLLVVTSRNKFLDLNFLRDGKKSVVVSIQAKNDAPKLNASVRSISCVVSLMRDWGVCRVTSLRASKSEVLYDIAPYKGAAPGRSISFDVKNRKVVTWRETE